MKDNELIDYLVQKKLINSNKVTITPLTGGISCQILLIDDGEHRLVLKKALKKLKVKEDWFADVKRNVVEQKYLKYVGGFLPNAVPKILYSDATHNFFCMEMLENGLENWKELLLKGQFDLSCAKKAGKILAEVHAKSINNSELANDFDTLDSFTELRIAPYLLRTADKNEAIASYFKAEAKRLSETKFCLVHGDFSPKNILVSDNRLVVLDCEVAWYGDPTFDIAFFLNHFMLKALHLKNDAKKVLQMASVIWNHYFEKMKPVVATDFEKNVVHLLPMLMLARVDGKSPVEYLSDKNKIIVKDFVCNELQNSSLSFEKIKINWLKTINNN
tara:strand:- start:2963 stop:3955 length:993 start_codon:yes stop_codon:yes gene_type:complete